MKKKSGGDRGEERVGILMGAWYSLSNPDDLTVEEDAGRGVCVCMFITVGPMKKL